MHLVLNPVPLLVNAKTQYIGGCLQFQSAILALEMESIFKLQLCLTQGLSLAVFVIIFVFTFVNVRV